MPADDLRSRRRPLGDGEVPEQPEGRGLDRLRVDGKEVIAKSALLLFPDLVGLKHRLAALRACHDQRHGAPSSMAGAD